MILVDTSVWIDHLRKGNADLRSLLYENRIVTHPFVIGEISCGHLGNREEILQLLEALPQTQTAEHYEVLRLIEQEHLYGTGIGWVDAHLIAAALLSRSKLWTLDKHLSRVIHSLGLSP
jgi:predicted nucleic acid-binding protein